MLPKYVLYAVFVMGVYYCGILLGKGTVLIYGWLTKVRERSHNMKFKWPWSKRMKIEKLLLTSNDNVGSYTTIDDWQNVTVQIASTAKDKPFNGTVSIEGTLDTDAETILWSPLLISKNEEILKLSGYALAGVRASTTGMVAGEVIVLVSGH
jgi:hypothetical protein